MGMLVFIKRGAFIVSLLTFNISSAVPIFSVKEKVFASFIHRIIKKASTTSQSFVYPWIVCRNAKAGKKAIFFSAPIFDPNDRNSSQELLLLRWLGAFLSAAHDNQINNALCSMQIDHFDVCLSQAAFSVTFAGGSLLDFEELFSNHRCEI